MIIAQGHDLEQQFGANTLFKNVNFSIDSNARIGLVGPNGAGKTTLLKIMTGQREPTQGEFTVNKEFKPVILLRKTHWMKIRRSGMKWRKFSLL